VVNETDEERRLRLELEKLIEENKALRAQLKNALSQRDALEAEVVPRREADPTNKKPR
jgi:hypothetical protein